MSNQPVPGRAFGMTPRSRRRTALACAVACLWPVTVTACAAESDEPDDPVANPWREWVTPDAACPVTLPMSPDRYPKALRDQEGKSTWYGEGPLWVDLAEFYAPAQQDDTVRVDHAWWTVDASGEATVEEGVPTVRATRLDGPGRAVATLTGRSDDEAAWWRTRLTFPEAGCWLVTGELDGTVVRVVAKAP